jgi:plastocyanin
MFKKVSIDWRNALLILAVVSIAGYIGLWLPYQNSKLAPLPVDSLGHAAEIVEYTKNGFEPETITVPLGTTVAWKNSGGLPMWVASDPHPAHTDLEGFDQLRVINKAIPPFVQTANAHGDGIYEYTFSTLGEWKYHNHLNPRHLGKVIVTPN